MEDEVIIYDQPLVSQDLLDDVQELPSISFEPSQIIIPNTQRNLVVGNWGYLLALLAFSALAAVIMLRRSKQHVVRGPPHFNSIEELVTYLRCPMSFRQRIECLKAILLRPNSAHQFDVVQVAKHNHTSELERLLFSQVETENAIVAAFEFVDCCFSSLRQAVIDLSTEGYSNKIIDDERDGNWPWTDAMNIYEDLTRLKQEISQRYEEAILFSRDKALEQLRDDINCRENPTAVLIYDIELAKKYGVPRDNEVLLRAEEVVAATHRREDADDIERGESLIQQQFEFQRSLHNVSDVLFQQVRLRGTVPELIADSSISSRDQAEITRVIHPNMEASTLSIARRVPPQSSNQIDHIELSIVERQNFLMVTNNLNDFSLRTRGEINNDIRHRRNKRDEQRAKAIERARHHYEQNESTRRRIAVEIRQRHNGRDLWADVHEEANRRRDVQSKRLEKLFSRSNADFYLCFVQSTVWLLIGLLFGLNPCASPIIISRQVCSSLCDMISVETTTIYEATKSRDGVLFFALNLQSIRSSVSTFAVSIISPVLQLLGMNDVFFCIINMVLRTAFPWIVTYTLRRLGFDSVCSLLTRGKINHMSWLIYIIAFVMSFVGPLTVALGNRFQSLLPYLLLQCLIYLSLSWFDLRLLWPINAGSIVISNSRYVILYVIYPLLWLGIGFFLANQQEVSRGIRLQQPGSNWMPALACVTNNFISSE